MKKLQVLEKSYECEFCFEMNFAGPDPEGLLCRNCGLEIANSGEESFRRMNRESDSMILERELEDEDFSYWLKELRAAKRRRVIGATAATLTALGLCGAALVALVDRTLDTGDTSDTTHVADTQMTNDNDIDDRMTVEQWNGRHVHIALDGYETAPEWTAIGEATQVLTTSDMRHVVVKATNETTIRDATTGKVLSHVLGSGDKTFDVAGDTIYSLRGQSLGAWTSERQAWLFKNVSDKATLKRHADTMTVVDATGTWLVSDDANQTLLNAPTDDATLVGVTETSFIWQQADMSLWLSPRETQSVAGRVVPLNGATGHEFKNVVFANDSIVVSLWVSEDHDTVRIQDIQSGTLLHSVDVPTGTATSYLTQDQRYLNIGNVTIDAQTGATTESVADVTGALVDGWMTKNNEAQRLVFPDRAEIVVPKDVNVRAGSADLIIIETAEGISAVKQKISKENK